MNIKYLKNNKNTTLKPDNFLVCWRHAASNLSVLCAFVNCVLSWLLYLLVLIKIKQYVNKNPRPGGETPLGPLWKCWLYGQPITVTWGVHYLFYWRKTLIYAKNTCVKKEQKESCFFPNVISVKYIYSTEMPQLVWGIHGLFPTI